MNSPFKKSKKSYKVGDAIEVKIIKVDILKYQIDLELTYINFHKIYYGNINQKNLRYFLELCLRKNIYY